MGKAATKKSLLDRGIAALDDHESSKDTIEFTEKVLHGRMVFQKGEVVQFANPAVASYFDVAFNGTEFTSKEPTRTVGDDEINFDASTDDGTETVDPHTVIGRGREGVEAGTTVFEHLVGEPGASRIPLEPDESTSGTDSEV